MATTVTRRNCNRSLSAIAERPFGAGLQKQDARNSGVLVRAQGLPQADLAAAGLAEDNHVANAQHEEDNAFPERIKHAGGEVADREMQRAGTSFQAYQAT